MLVDDVPRPDRTTQIHVLSDEDPEIERYLLFRNRLRTDQPDREFYERTKRELAQREWTYVQNYADAKGDVIEAIIARARQGYRRPIPSPLNEGPGRCRLGGSHGARARLP